MGIEDKMERPARRSFELNWTDRNGRNFHLASGHETVIMGVLNLTPDSFYDGGSYPDAEAAVARALSMEEAGAGIIDIGGESSRPGSRPVPEDEELKRVLPVLESLADRLRIPISIDTYKAAIARRALEAGAQIINDISALRLDPELVGVVAEVPGPYIMMHMRGTPGNMQD
ncbi:MAG: dihydropteroate synthase, partial [Candidatus Auribacterota bacterium]|nr:dihydropteroate synthase [Candidatus Auribacterota bacterium]